MAETLARSLIRLLVTVGILAAVYFFAIRPILDTTNNAIDRAFEPFDSIQSGIEQSFDEAGLGGFDVDSIDIDSKSNEKARKLLECVQRVQPNQAKMQACVTKFQ